MQSQRFIYEKPPRHRQPYLFNYLFEFSASHVHIKYKRIGRRYRRGSPAYTRSYRKLIAPRETEDRSHVQRLQQLYRKTNERFHLRRGREMMDIEIGTFGNASNSGSGGDCIRKHYTNNAYQRGRTNSGPFD